MQLVTFGEAMLRISPRDSGFDVHVGGAELNVAVGATKLGVPSRWLTRLPNNAAGRAIADRARTEGVDVSHVLWTEQGRVGIYYVEVGDEPSKTRVTYDRAGSTMACVAPGMIEWRNALRDGTWFHVSGITPALSEGARCVMGEALSIAHDAGLAISYDLNYRPQLWTAEQARAAQEELIRFADVFIASEDAARLVFGLSAAPDALARELQQRYHIPNVVITIRDSKRARFASWNALVATADGVHRAEAKECEVIDPIGAGDAFTAGLIVSRMHNESWDASLRAGVRLAALKHATPGDFSTTTGIPR